MICSCFRRQKQVPEIIIQPYDSSTTEPHMTNWNPSTDSSDLPVIISLPLSSQTDIDSMETTSERSSSQSVPRWIQPSIKDASIKDARHLPSEMTLSTSIKDAKHLNPISNISFGTLPSPIRICTSNVIDRSN